MGSDYSISWSLLTFAFKHFGLCEHYILKFTLVRGLILSSQKSFLTVNELILSWLYILNIDLIDSHFRLSLFIKRQIECLGNQSAS